LNKKSKEDLEAMRKRILEEVEPVIEKKTQDVVGQLFPKGGLSKGPGGLSYPRGLGGG